MTLAHPDRLEDRLMAVLRGLENDWRAKYPKRAAIATRQLMTRLGQLGRKLGYDSYSRNSSNGEWLFDMTWIQNKRGYLNNVPLVLESEWADSAGKARDDFEKLIVARAQHRVFIHYAFDTRRAHQAISQLIRYVTRSALTLPGDRYLFACWTDLPKEFVFHLHRSGAA